MGQRSLGNRPWGADQGVEMVWWQWRVMEGAGAGERHSGLFSKPSCGCSPRSLSHLTAPGPSRMQSLSGVGMSTPDLALSGAHSEGDRNNPHGQSLG